MSEDFETYLKDIKFEKYLKNLKKKAKNKTVIFYGVGSLFQYIKNNYDLSSFNIIGVSDAKFLNEEEGQIWDEYKIIPKNKMPEYNPDIVIIGTINYLKILEGFVINMFKDTKTKVYPLARIPLFELIKKIWSR